MHRVSIRFILFAVASVWGCADRSDKEPGACQWNDAGRPEALSALGCAADHEALAGEPTAAALPGNRSVMFVIERKRDNAIHFFDTMRWRHFTFARDRLEGFQDLTVFNAEMYFRPDRRLYLGTLVHHLGPGVFTVELSPLDKATPEMIGEIYELVEASLGFEADLRYHPTSNALQMASRLPAGVPLITTAELYQGAVYQGLHLGRTVGRLHVTTLDRLATEYVSRMDIVVVDRVPNDIPVVAGLVTGEFQTPLSHVNLLAQNRGTPNMALIDATENPAFLDRDGEWVSLSVGSDGFDLQPASRGEAERFWSDRRPKAPQAPDIDLSVRELVDVEAMNSSWVAAVGGKAANFAELEKIEPAIPLPDAFAVPCSAYVDFMETSGLRAEVERMLLDPAFGEDGLVRMAALASLRDKIRAAEVDPELVTSIQKKIEEKIGAVPVRFRSSSNAEDLEQFNGAGLYDSATYRPGSPDRTVSRALLEVWASLWSFAAFEEREWARIEHLACAMGVLVHRSFPDAEEAANGVAITDNPFDPPPGGQAAYYVNAQQGATSVANPLPGVTPESFLYFKPPAGQGEISYLSTSSLTGGEPVLAFDEIVSLTRVLKAIHDHFSRIYTRAEPYAMDVEFKWIGPERSLIIKQARPYSF